MKLTDQSPLAAAIQMRSFSLRRGKAAIILAACLGIALGLAVRNLAWYPLHVTSNSMFPAVAKGDWVVISPQHAIVERGNIVLFRFPFGGEGRAIKRVVAVPGDRVEATLIPEGYYYILGDNAASSVDSRTLGLLPQEDVMGKVAAIIRKPW